MKIHWKKLIVCLLIPLAVGGLSALLSAAGIRDFAGVRQPLLAPPAALFPIAWTVLYLLMGAASYLVITADVPTRHKNSAVTNTSDAAKTI